MHSIWICFVLFGNCKLSFHNQLLFGQSKLSIHRRNVKIFQLHAVFARCRCPQWWGYFNADIQNFKGVMALHRKGTNISVSTWVSVLHYCRSELEPINSRDCRAAESFDLRIIADWLLCHWRIQRVVCPVWKWYKKHNWSTNDKEEVLATINGHKQYEKKSTICLLDLKDTNSVFQM